MHQGSIISSDDFITEHLIFFIYLLVNYYSFIYYIYDFFLKKIAFTDKSLLKNVLLSNSQNYLQYERETCQAYDMH